MEPMGVQISGIDQEIDNENILIQVRPEDLIHKVLKSHRGITKGNKTLPGIHSAHH